MGSIKGGYFSGELSNYYLLKKDSSPWSYLQDIKYVVLSTWKDLIQKY
jgi:hypothetical protein